MWPFDPNRQNMYQSYANAWDQGRYHQLPDEEVQQNYQQFVQNAPPHVVQQVLEEYFRQAPPEQSTGLMQEILSGLAQREVNPQQFGVLNTDPYYMSPQEAARLAGYGQQQHPGLLQQAMRNPAAKAAIAGLVAYAAKQMLSSPRERSW